MRTIFLSMSFRPDDSDKIGRLADAIGRLLQSHNLKFEIGRDEGRRLTDMVKERIAAADGLVALLSRREPITSDDPQRHGRFRTSQWIIDELSYARSLTKPSIALVESGVLVEGMAADYEFLPLDPAAPLEALLRLSSTLHNWKQRSGRTIVVRLQPKPVADLAVATDGSVELTYRFVHGGEAGPWYPAVAFPSGGSAKVFLKGFREGAEVQLKLTRGDDVWLSDLEPESIIVVLQRQVRVG